VVRLRQDPVVRVIFCFERYTSKKVSRVTNFLSSTEQIFNMLDYDCMYSNFLFKISIRMRRMLVRILNWINYASDFLNGMNGKLHDYPEQICLGLVSKKFCTVFVISESLDINN